MNLVISILIGAISGWIASVITNSSSGLLKNIILGLVGGFVGEFICNLLHISFAGYLGTIIVSVAGACLVVFVVNKIFKWIDYQFIFLSIYGIINRKVINYEKTKKHWFR